MWLARGMRSVGKVFERHPNRLDKLISQGFIPSAHEPLQCLPSQAAGPDKFCQAALSDKPDQIVANRRDFCGGLLDVCVHVGGN